MSKNKPTHNVGMLDQKQRNHIMNEVEKDPEAVGDTRYNREDLVSIFAKTFKKNKLNRKAMKFGDDHCQNCGEYADFFDDEKDNWRMCERCYKLIKKGL